MEYIDGKEIVVIFDRRMGLETIVSKLALLTGEQTKKFFTERSTMIPRKINAMALRGALNERIKTLNSHSLTKDAFVKLESYASFTEFQLQNLFEKVGTDEDFYTYRKNLWKLLIKNHGGINLLDGEVTRLLNMKKYASIENFMDYSKAIFSVTLDLPKEFDAYPKANFENLLKTSFSQDEIRSLGSKYGFNIPLRLKKEDLLQYVKDMMKAKRKLTLVLQRELNNMTITQLNDFCYLQNLGISSGMKKEELINLFLFLIKQANFPAIEANTILGMSFTEPLKFRVDLDAIDNFKRGRPKKVIFFDEDDTAGLEALDELVEPMVEAPKKKNKQEDLATDIIRKLLPYLNIDEETAKMAIAYGIKIPQAKPASPKKDSSVSQKKKTLKQ
ncbi:MAG: hypothetical protein K2N64_07360 [Anaeroplasmataceae bacterium]|nr:hypothetical protein [Anaeroplasmataceae bacterium]